METNNIPTVCTMCNCNVAIEMIDGSIIKVPMDARFSPEGFTIGESVYPYEQIVIIYGLEPLRVFVHVPGSYYPLKFTEVEDADVKSYKELLENHGIL